MFTCKEQQHLKKEPVFQQKMWHQEKMKPNLHWMDQRQICHPQGKHLRGSVCLKHVLQFILKCCWILIPPQHRNPPGRIGIGMPPCPWHPACSCWARTCPSHPFPSSAGSWACLAFLPCPCHRCQHRRTRCPILCVRRRGR